MLGVEEPLATYIRRLLSRLQHILGDKAKFATGLVNIASI